MLFLYLLALSGFVLSGTVHMATFLGMNLERVFPEVWFLHIGIFVVWIPALFRLGKARKKEMGWAPLNFFRNRNIPRWSGIVYEPLCLCSLQLLLYRFGP